MNQNFKILTVLFVSFAVLACADSYKHLSQKIKTPDGKHWIALFTDYDGIGDPSWHVYKFDISEKVENKIIKRNTLYNGELFWNYAEAGNDTENVRILIISDRYILFERGGIYHSLYDLQTEKILVNDESPWHSFQGSEEYKGMPKGTKLMNKAYILEHGNLNTYMSPFNEY